MPDVRLRDLFRLAAAWGVQTAYYDGTGMHRRVPPEALLAVLRALGTPLEGLADVPAALREFRQARVRRRVEPVRVAWDGYLSRFPLWVPAARADTRLTGVVLLEGGARSVWTWDLTAVPTVRALEVEGETYVCKVVSGPERLPLGYHRVVIEFPDRRAETQVIAAPSRIPGVGTSSAERVWGVWIPLYALHAQRGWGAGDFSDLTRLIEWVTGLGGRLVGTLPLLAAFLDEPYAPSPYEPVSRRFWNEFYVDVEHIPELDRCPGARAQIADPEFQEGLRSLRTAGLVDYRALSGRKRAVLERLAETFFADPGSRETEFREFLQDRPDVEDYARFRAATERLRAPWPAWPTPMRTGVLREEDVDPRAYRYHVYAQWIAHEQMGAAARTARARGADLYLDVPVGVHRHGYDVWRDRSAFVPDVSVGAPPDPVFAKGQDWGFPPFHPEGIREAGYRPFIEVLRHHLRYARRLRIDHVMGFHRLFWIPHGFDVSEGTYVRYPAEEWYAVLTLEASRRGALIVGEDLGTVPPYVRHAMARHGVLGMYILPYEVDPARAEPLRPVGPDVVAALNTHDMPTFAGFWEGRDIELRREWGLLGAAEARAAEEHRQAVRRALVDSLRRAGFEVSEEADVLSVLQACLVYLGQSPAPVVVINLEDLWGETRPQNVPGTGPDRPNWRRKARYDLETLTTLPVVEAVLRRVDAARKTGPAVGIPAL